MNTLITTIHDITTLMAKACKKKNLTGSFLNALSKFEYIKYMQYKLLFISCVSQSIKT